MKKISFHISKDSFHFLPSIHILKFFSFHKTRGLYFAFLCFSLQIILFQPKLNNSEEMTSE